MEPAVYPREKPRRLFFRLLWLGPVGAPALPLLTTAALAGLLWLLSEGRGLTPAERLLGIAGGLLLWRLLLRLRALRATYLTAPGLELPPRLELHPLIRPALATAVAALAMLTLTGLIRGGIVNDQLPAALLIASLAGHALYALMLAALRRQEMTQSPDGLEFRRLGGLDGILFADVDRLVWRAGRTGSDPDRLELHSGKKSVRLGGWHERSDDHIRNLLRLILQPRLETAREQFRRAGHLACGPLRVYPDHFSRPDDTPPLRLPFALARSAHIDDQGRLAVEIEGRHEPLVLLGPEEYPLTPLVLRLISELWTVPAPPEENASAETAGIESGEETEWVN